MLKKLISKNWYFSNGGDYKPVDLPHDYQVASVRSADAQSGPNNGYYPDVKGNYVKHLSLEGDKHYILDLDGAYMCTEVTVNENHAGYHPYGYTPYLVDITPYLIPDCTCKLKISTTPLALSSRWYNGNGIYRDVFLWEGGDIRIEPWDMFVYTKGIKDDKAEMAISYTLTADVGATAELRFSVIAPNGTEVLRKDATVRVRAGEKKAVTDSILVSSPCLWSPDTPSLYALRTEIYRRGKLLDSTETVFGIRTVTADAANGLLLNGQPIKLRGGCIHHDHAVLGAAAFPAAEERKLKRLKDMGFNSVRCAHNPPSLAFLECCDRLGIIVMDEAFDVWQKPKRTNDYHLFFSDWCLRDISYMVLRDRSHPSVISYSIGNEIYEIDGTSRAGEISKMLSDEIRKYDPTRLVTSGIQKGFATAPKGWGIDPQDYKAVLDSRFRTDDQVKINGLTAEYEKPLDIVGCNYYYSKYGVDHGQYPDRVLWGSENVALQFYDSWQAVLDNPYVIGDFTWTAYDNMGEVGAGQFKWARNGFQNGITLGAFPWRACYQGDYDLCGYRRPQSYFRQAVWGNDTEPRIFVTHPEHYGESFSGTNWHWYDVDECWSFEEKYIGRPVSVETYTSADEIVFYVNGREVGRSVPVKAIARISTVYEPGEIMAVAIKNGVEISSFTLSTVGAPVAINVFAEREEFLADRRDLCYFDISVVDRDGKRVISSKAELTCLVTGGELMGIFSGDPASDDQYTSNKAHAFDGRAVAVVRTSDPGCVGVTVFSDGLASGHAKSKAKPQEM